MERLLHIARVLDEFEQFHLSDKLFKVAQSSPRQIADSNVSYPLYPTNPRNIDELRKKLVPTDFRGQVYQVSKGDNILNTSDIKSFAVGLMEYARINKFPNLTSAFDAYANAGARFRGKILSSVPELRELYTRISKTTSAISRQMVEQELSNIFINPQINTGSANVPQNNTGVSAVGNVPQNNTSNSSQNTSRKNVSLSSSDPKSFANNLLNFMESGSYKRDGNLAMAFNDYADAGATYGGVSIKQIPALKKAYDFIAGSYKFFNEYEIEQIVDNSFKTDVQGPLIQSIRRQMDINGFSAEEKAKFERSIQGL